MAEPRTIRRVAFQVLFQMDITGEADARALVGPVADERDLSASERERVVGLASDAYAGRGSADAAVAELAPEWPPHRQPAVDRNVLRLAYHEMTAGITPPKVAVSEAVKLAKEFSTEKSPAFVNAILDKLLKGLPAPTATATEADA
ncbi:MAG: transcription antitermination factor NusB [Planctomycetota bacterium]